MRRLMKLLVPVAGTIVSVAVLAPPALANTQVKTVNHVNFTYVEKEVCPFHLSVHLEGSYKSVDYYDGSGFLYKEINTSGGRRFEMTAWATRARRPQLQKPRIFSSGVHALAGAVLPTLARWAMQLRSSRAIGG